MKPYYEDSHATIYHGDCWAILPLIACDVVVTDPPYPAHKSYGWEVPALDLWPKHIVERRGFYFWYGDQFPLPFTARHIWAKANRNQGSSGEQYEVFYEVNGNRGGLVMRHAVIDSEMNATLNGDVFLCHPCQKPVRLIRRIVALTSGVVLDPFCGSGTTLFAAKSLGRRAIGIEIEERYCEIAAERLAQDVLPWQSDDLPQADDAVRLWVD